MTSMNAPPEPDAGPDFEAFGRAVRTDCIVAIAAFARTKKNRGVYAFAIHVDLGQGGFTVSLNTETGLRRTIEAKYPDDPDAYDTGFDSLRNSAGDHVFMGIVAPSAETQKRSDALSQAIRTSDDDTYPVLLQQYADCFVTVIQDLDFHLRELDTVRDFVAYVTAFDASQEDQVQLMRRTVDAERFDRLFPEFRKLEVFEREINALEPAAQVDFWMGAMEAFYRGLSTERTRRLHALGKEQWDVRAHLQALGFSAVPSLLALMNRVALAPQFNGKGTPEFEQNGAATPDSNLYSAAIWALIDIGSDAPGSQVIESHLRRHLADLHQAAGPGEGIIGSNCHLTARAMHTLWPERYPKAQFGATNNRLLNAAEFGLVE